MVLQGAVQGGRRRGRQTKRWEDNVTEWTGLKINRTCKDDPTGYCTRREKERQTDKEMGRQCNGMDRIKDQQDLQR